jgi:hypothetical protein
LFSFDTNYKFPHGLTARIRRVICRATGRRRFFILPGKVRTVGRLLASAGLRPLGIDSHFALALRGENLADQHYETTIGFPALGTTLFCGAEIRF